MASPTEVRNQWAQYFREQDQNELYRRQTRVIMDYERLGRMADERREAIRHSRIPIRAFILCPHCKGLISVPPQYGKHGRFAPCSCGCWVTANAERYLFLQKQEPL